MTATLRTAFGRLFVALDIVLAPFVALALILLRTIRRTGIQRMPVARSLSRRLGTLAITSHYYDPWPTQEDRPQPLDRVRDLPGIDMKLPAQLDLLRQFNSQPELTSFPLEGPLGTFRYRNGTFGAGDAEFLYSLIRLKKPSRIVEIGGGNSTLIAAAALAANLKDDASYKCQHICVEPYENPWLERTGSTILRQTVEIVDRKLFRELQRDDILFIDTSHIIRPQGDVLTLYLEILPTVAPGVFVHAHDIFTPRNYPSRWLDDEMLLWNEQYLLEAFLSNNRDFSVVAALNMLYHDHRPAMNATFPILASEGGPEPGSFWFVRN